MSSKGQIVIPKAMRELLGIEEGECSRLRRRTIPSSSSEWTADR